MKLLSAVAWLIAVVAIAAVAYLAVTPAAPNAYAVYQDATERLASVRPPAAGSPAETAALERVTGFFNTMSIDTVTKQTRRVYARDAVLSDTLAVIRGHAAIEAYYTKTAEQADEVSIEILNVIRQGDDYFLRWRMQVRHPAIADGEPLVSFGMTHVRLNEAGEIALHYDFWDSAAGFFDYVPGIGSALRRIRSRIH
ncbi:MAG: nuclear transport factor 2 family protein [Pseudomonadota bacterium]